MNTLGRILCIVAVCMFLSTSLALSTEKPESITVGYMDFNKPPLWMQDGTGLDLVLVKMAGKQLGIEVNFRAFPWRRCQLMLRYNELDGIIGSSFKQERMKIGKYPFTSDGAVDESVALHMDGYTFYRRKGDPVDYDGNQLIGLTGLVGAHSGASIVDKLKKKGITVQDTAKTTEQNFKMLQARRYQVIVDSGIRADYYLKTHPKLQTMIEKISTPYGHSGRFLIFSHSFYQQYPNIAEQLWSHIRELKDSEEFKKLSQEAWQ